MATKRKHLWYHLCKDEPQLAAKQRYDRPLIPDAVRRGLPPFWMYWPLTHNGLEVKLQAWLCWGDSHAPNGKPRPGTHKTLPIMALVRQR